MSDSEENWGQGSEGKDTSSGAAYFAPGKMADHKHGLLYQGDYQHESDGTGVAIRLNARALASQGVPLLLKPFSNVVLVNGTYEPFHLAGISEAVEKEVGSLTRSAISGLFPYIRHFVIHKSEDIGNRLMRGAVGPLDDPEIVMRARKAVFDGTVLYSVWERDRISSQMVRELRRVGDNWVPCEQNAEMLRSCGVEKVFVVPHPYDPESPLLHLTKRKPHKEKRFYFIGRWEPRKNAALILQAFFRTFRPGDPARLTMKYHGQWADYPSPEEVLQDVQSSYPEWTDEKIKEHLVLIKETLRPDQIVKLHYENNIYLAPSAGEAWCLPAFEAKQAGNLVIYVPYGGMRDFCGRLQDWSLAYSMGKVPDSYGWPAGSQWAVPDIADLCEAMSLMHVPDIFFRTPEFEERFSLAAVGKLMVDRIRSVWGEQVKW